ncbi:MAG: hypothetical protein JXL97_10115 [Bacteroidales bacterium]|nr:hypothetical protein [Bacteroidales bacterium]
MLILFVLPSDNTDWLNISDKELILKKCAYWYLPDKKELSTTNSSTKRISINKNNYISNETLNNLFENYS